MAVETGRVESNGVERESGQDVEGFGMKIKTTRDGLIF
jgi:hypothetical protein